MVRPLRRRREVRWKHLPANRVVCSLGWSLKVTDSSEIPCRVSSDLHEWRNDFPTVSGIGSAKLNSP